MNDLIKSNIRVAYNQAIPGLDVSFSGFITYDELVEAVEYEFVLIRRYGLRKCVVNLRDISVYPEGGHAYIKEVWFPEVIQLGIVAVAFVVPDDVFAQVSMEEAHSLEQIPLTTKHFRDADEAMTWICDFEYKTSHAEVRPPYAG